MFIALIVVSCVLAVFVGAWLFRKDTERENRRKAAIVCAKLSADFGLTHLPNFFTCMAVGDLSGCWQEVKQFSALAAKPELFGLELDKVLKHVVTKQASTPEGRAKVAGLLNAATPA